MADEALRSVFAEFGFRWDSDALDRGEKKVKAAESTVREFAQGGVIDALKGKLASINPTLGELVKNFDSLSAREKTLAKNVLASAAILAGAGVALKKAFEFADAFAQKTEELRDTARDLKVTTTELQELRYAAAQSGVGVDRMGSALKKFRADLNAAERWGNSTTWMLRRLGVQTRDSAGHIRNEADLLDDLAVALDRVPNPARRTRIAIHLFGEEGRRMLDVLHGGPGGLRALREELGALGGGVTEEAAQASREYTMATTRLSVAQDALRSVLATAVIPLLTWIVSKVTAVTVVFVRFTRGTRLAEVAIGALAVAGTAAAAQLILAWAPVVLPFLLAGLAIAGVILQVEDIIGLFNGADSSIGRFIDRLFGVGTAATQVRYLKEEFQELINFISENLWVLGPLAELASLAATEKPAEGRLGQRFNARQALRRGPVAPLTTGAVNAPALVAPATRQVTAPSSLVTPVRNTTVQQSTSNTFHVTSSDPRLAARETLRLFNEQQARQRDAAAPILAED